MTPRSRSLLIVALALTATVPSLAGAGLASGATTCAGLPAAITAANATPEDDVIDLEPNQTCTLRAPLPELAGDATIDGHGSWLRPSPGHPMELLRSIGNITVRNVTLSGGVPAVRATVVTVDHATLRNNPIGAVVATPGYIEVRSSRIIANGGAALSAVQGARVLDSELVANRVAVSGGQGAGVINSLVRRNGVGVTGMTVAAIGSTLDWNDTALSSSEGISVEGSRVTDNGTGTLATMFLRVTDSVIARNERIGHILSTKLTRSSFYDNEQGLRIDTGEVTNSTFAHGEDLTLQGRGRVDFSTLTGKLHSREGGLESNASIIADCELADWAWDWIPSTGTANVSPDDDCPGRASSAAPRLRALGDNGGPTPTQGLGAGSPARDVVPAATCDVATDQRGLPRPSGLACDAGAFEAQVATSGTEVR